MKKFLGLFVVLNFFIVSSISVIGCSSINQETKINLDDLILNKDLQYIFISGEMPSKQEIFTGIVHANNNLGDFSINDFDFTSKPSSTSATLVGKNQFQGEIILSYIKDTRNNVNEIITKTDFKGFFFSGITPEKQEILTIIKTYIQDAEDLTLNMFDFVEPPSSTSAIIKGINNLSGEINITYFKKNKTDLSSLSNLSGFTLTIDPAKKAYEWNSQIINASEFTNQPLFEPTINYYYSQKDDTKLNNYRQDNHINYYQIIASSNDLLWNNSTIRFSLPF